MAGKHHVDGDQEQQDAAGNPQGGQGDAEDFKDSVACEGKEQQYAAGDQNATRGEDETLLGRVAACQPRKDEGDIGNTDSCKKCGEGHEKIARHRPGPQIAPLFHVNQRSEPKAITLNCKSRFCWSVGLIGVRSS